MRKGLIIITPNKLSGTLLIYFYIFNILNFIYRI